MTPRKLFCVLIGLSFLNAGVAQVINPGGGVSSMSGVPGLTNKLALIDADNAISITNAISSGSTGANTGSVEKITPRIIDIKFPSVAQIVTNQLNGFFTNSITGTNTVNWLPVVFDVVPYVSFTLRDGNANEVAVPVIDNVTVTNVVMHFVGSGGVITNGWIVTYRASEGYSRGVFGTTLGNLENATIGGNLDFHNLYGVTNLSSLQLKTGALANSWLSGNSSGYGSWQARTIANLNDGTNVFKRDGTASAFAFKMVAAPVARGVMISDVSGNATWDRDSNADRWYLYPALGNVAMGGKNIVNVGSLSGAQGAFSGALSGLGGLTVQGNSTFGAGTFFYVSPSATFASPATFNSQLVMAHSGGSHASPNLSVQGVARYYHTGGSVANPDFAVAGVSKMGAIITSSSSAGCGLYVGAGGNEFVEGALHVVGVISSDSQKTFRINHPKDSSKYLFHAAIESPRVELLYRGKTRLVSGKATVNLNTYYGLIPDTLNDMLKNLTVQVYDNESFTRVRCSRVLSSISFEIEAESPLCDDTVDWTAIAERCDAGVKDYQMEVPK